MTSMKLMLVVGARPQIIKSAPIIREVLKRFEVELQFVHTGQHYDYEMSKVFFNELDLPDPLVNLGVGSGSHGWQTGEMLTGLEKAVLRFKPDVVLVPGDTNSTLAAALAAVKLHVPVGHVEAGARSYDMMMPEEVNRRLTDHCSTFLFTVSETCTNNLLKEGITKKRVFQVGDTMYDSLLQHRTRAMKSNILEKLDLKSDGYVVLTAHRPRNVDDPANLKSIVDAVSQLSDTVVFPVHPRTKERLQRSGLIKFLEKKENVRLIDPVGYHEMQKLVAKARLVLTDSGGLQKEAFWLHTPCITLRDRTEWMETVECGANVLVGNDKGLITQYANEYLADENVKQRIREMINPFGSGKASKEILKHLSAGTP